MAHYKPVDTSQSVLIPLNFNEQFIPGTFLFAINHLIENKIDLSGFDHMFRNDALGCAAYHPKIMLKIVLYAYSLGITSSRKIEYFCRKHVDFMALAGGHQPKKSKIAEFVSSLGSQIDAIFEHILMICEEEDLLGGTAFALDGVKLPSDASKSWSGTHKELAHKQDKIRQRLHNLRREHLDNDKTSDPQQPEEEKEAYHIKKLEHQVQRLTQFLEQESPKKGRKKKEIKSNVTDNESAKMTTSHGTIQGYNANALTDAKHQVIIHGEAFGNGQDYEHVAPMIDGAKKNMTAAGHPETYFENKVFTADTSYHSQDNLEKCRDEKMDAYIPDNNFRLRDPRFSGQHPPKSSTEDMYSSDDFDYDPETDTFFCPQKKRLKRIARNVKQSGTFHSVYGGNKEDCTSCKERHNCLQSPKTKRRILRRVTKRDETSLSNQMIDKIDTALGRHIYGLRFAVVEPVFGNICSNKGLNRFTLRTKAKVDIQWKLYCLVHNIEKITKYGRRYLNETAYA